MDLGTCPRCGVDWISGDEVCRQCGFIPIGAGLKDLPRPIRVERRRLFTFPPGTRSGYVLSLTFLTLLLLGFQYEPWSNDWEALRIVLGDTRSQSIVGTWTVVRSSLLDANGLPLSVNDSLAGKMAFYRSMKVQLSLQRGGAIAQAEGVYSLHGDTLILKNMRSVNGMSGIPLRIRMDLDWTSGNTIGAIAEDREQLDISRSSAEEPVSLW